VAVVGRLVDADPARTVVVATADRDLKGRVSALGATVIPPRLVRP
jgi:hypothetical protein